MLENPQDPWVRQVCWEETGGGEAGGDTGNGEALGRLAVHAAMHLLFLPGFTVDDGAFDAVLSDAATAARSGFALVSSSSAADGGSTEATAAAAAEHEHAEDLALALRHPGAAWFPGVGVDEDLVARTGAFDRNRVEVSHPAAAGAGQTRAAAGGAGAGAAGTARSKSSRTM